MRYVPGRGLTHPRRCCLLQKVAHGVHLFWGFPVGGITPPPVRGILYKVEAAMEADQAARAETAVPT